MQDMTRTLQESQHMRSFSDQSAQNDIQNSNTALNNYGCLTKAHLTSDILEVGSHWTKNTDVVRIKIDKGAQILPGSWVDSEVFSPWRDIYNLLRQKKKTGMEEEEKKKTHTNTKD